MTGEDSIAHAPIPTVAGFGHRRGAAGGRGAGVTARFILSLDCEGKWGMADRLTPRLDRALSEANLRAAYAALAALLAEYDIAATFCFVGCFVLPAYELRRLPLRAIAAELPYLVGAVEGIAAGAEGWTGDWALDAVAPRHEIGLHGVTHVPWTSMTAAQARREMALVPLHPGITFAFPRNRVAHPHILEEFDILGYRAAPRPRSRLRSLAAEFDLGAQPDADEPMRTPQTIPAGHFVNWPSGPRRLVPLGLTRARARLMLERAADAFGVVHYWSHPENVATAPQTLAVLRAILQEVARLRDRGRLVVMTQSQYCHARAREHARIRGAAVAPRDGVLAATGAL